MKSVRRYVCLAGVSLSLVAVTQWTLGGAVQGPPQVPTGAGAPQRPPGGAPGGGPPGQGGVVSAGPQERHSAAGPVPATLLTVAERTGYTETSLYDDVMAFMRAVAARDARIHLTTFGYSFEGRALPLAVIGARDATPEAVKATGKVRIYIQANIHAGEVEGKEACLQILRAIARGQHAGWLHSAVLLVAPIFNPDGNDRVALTNRGRQNGPIGGMGQRANAQLPVNLDLNRDFMKMESPEDRSMALLYQRYDPHLEVDLHTTDGSLHAYQLTYNSPLHPATAKGVIAVLRDELLPAVTKAVKAKDGYDFYYYGNLPFRGSTERIFAADPDLYTPRYEENYVGLRNRLGILSETFAYLPFQDRIKVARRFVEEIVDWAAANPNRIKQATAEGDGQSIVGQDVAIAGKAVRSAQPVPILMGECEEERNPYTGAVMLRRKNVSNPESMYEAIAFEASDTIRAPRAYILPPPAPAATGRGASPPAVPGTLAARTLQRIVDRLQAHGIRMFTTGRPMTVKGEQFKVTSTKAEDREYQGHKARTTTGEWTAADVHVPAGSTVVPVDQPLGRVVFLLLEPRSSDSLAYWNLFEDDLGKTQPTYPVTRTMETIAK